MKRRPTHRRDVKPDSDSAAKHDRSGPYCPRCQPHMYGVYLAKHRADTV